MFNITDDLNASSDPSALPVWVLQQLREQDDMIEVPISVAAAVNEFADILIEGKPLTFVPITQNALVRALSDASISEPTALINKGVCESVSEIGTIIEKYMRPIAVRFDDYTAFLLGKMVSRRKLLFISGGCGRYRIISTPEAARKCGILIDVYLTVDLYRVRKPRRRFWEAPSE